MEYQIGDDSARTADFDLAKSIIESSDVFALVVETMTRRGFVGDVRQVELLYALFTSRLLTRPMCAFIKAPSSSGKSWLLNRTLDLFPPEAYEIKSGFSPKAIAYGKSDLRHRILAVQEASGLNGREGNMLVRTLISEGQVRWEVAGRQRGGFATREVVRPGPIAFVLTTTHDTLHAEDETRALSIQVEDTRQNTRQVIRNIGRQFAGGPALGAVDLAPWQAYQRWLEAGPRAAVIPFAEAIGTLVLIPANRSKRDFEQLLAAIAVSALMHQVRRERDEAGRVIATLDDYVHARRFLDKPLNEASGSAIPPGVRETVAALLDHSGLVNPDDAGRPVGMTVDQLAVQLRVDKSSASRRVAIAKQLGFIADLGGGGGRRCCLVAVQPLAGDWDVLPAPEYVEQEVLGTLDAYLRQQAAATDETKLAADAARRAALEPAPLIDYVPPPPPAIIAHAPDRDHPDGRYREETKIREFRAAMTEWVNRGKKKKGAFVGPAAAALGTPKMDPGSSPG